MSITQALIMAAGEAKRMRPLTDNLPKPLLKVGGQPLLSHIVEHLLEVGVTRIIINGYHAIEPLKRYVSDIQKTHPTCDFILSEETELLETGGGAVQALQYLDKDQPFFMINGDAYWVNPDNGNTLKDLSNAWEKQNFDLLLLLQSCTSMNLTGAVGDYNIQDESAVRSKDKNGSYMFTGVRICNPDILSGYKATPFSFLEIMDDVESKDRLGGLGHQGQWYHISTPADLEEVNRELFGMAS